MKPLSKKSSDRANANNNKSDDGDFEMETSNFDLKSMSQSLDAADGGDSSPGGGTGSGQSDVEAAGRSSFNLADLSKALPTVSETRIRASLQVRYEMMKARHDRLKRMMMRFRKEKVVDRLADKDVQKSMRIVMQVLEDDGGRSIPLISVYRVPRARRYGPKKDDDMPPPPPSTPS